MISLDDVTAAARRIAGHVRRKPMIEAEALQRPIANARASLPLEYLQATGPFNPDGAARAPAPTCGRSGRSPSSDRTKVTMAEPLRVRAHQR